MTDKELFNAINEIDEKYITAAWTNTDLTSDTVVIHESGKGFKLRTAGLAAACVVVLCAAVLAVFMRAGQRSVVTPPANASGTNDDPPSYVFSEVKPLRGIGPLPITLYGPDLIGISKGDVNYISLNGTDVVGSAEFVGGSWEHVSCDNFTYLAPPKGLSTNSADDPELYADYSLPDAGFETGTFDNSDYRRYSVGEKYGSLTLTDAGCIFKNQGSSPEERFSSCFAEFEGTVTLRAYLLRSSTVKSDAVICIPKSSELALPVMFPCADGRRFTSKAYIGGTMSGDFIYKSE